MKRPQPKGPDLSPEEQERRRFVQHSSDAMIRLVHAAEELARAGGELRAAALAIQLRDGGSSELGAHLVEMADAAGDLRHGAEEVMACHAGCGPHFIAIGLHTETEGGG